MAESCSAGLLAHCVYPIVLSNPFTSTILHLGQSALPRDNGHERWHHSTPWHARGMRSWREDGDDDGGVSGSSDASGTALAAASARQDRGLTM
jgi:hypothetical protein